MKTFGTLSLALLTLVLLTAATVAPAAAQEPAASAALTQYWLPPLPEWPIIGPVLRSLGLVEAAQETLPVPDPARPEYRIRDFEDLDALDQIEEGRRVRFIAADEDLNRMIREILDENIGREATMTLRFEAHRLGVAIQADDALLDEAGVELPTRIRGNLDLAATLRLTSEDCVPRVAFEEIRLNRWSFGLRFIAQRLINARMPEMWPSTICVEQILLLPGEAAVEGYRR